MENKKKRSASQFNIWHCCEFPPLPVTPADFRSFVSGPVSRFGAPRQTTAVADGCVSAVRASVSLALICASRCVSRRPRISWHPYYRTLAKKKKKPARCSSYISSCRFQAELAAKKRKKNVSSYPAHFSPSSPCSAATAAATSSNPSVSVPSSLRLSGSKLQSLLIPVMLIGADRHS